MKKLISALLAVCMLASAPAVLAGCAEQHTHSYRDEWRRNGDHHWHACKDERCDSTVNKAEHIWDSGTVILAPTMENEGKQQFRCTVCGYEKNEPISYVYTPEVDAAAWEAAFKALSNCEIETVGFDLTQSLSNVPIERYRISESGFWRAYTESGSAKEVMYLRDNNGSYQYTLINSAQGSKWERTLIDQIPAVDAKGTTVPLMQTRDMFAQFVYNPETMRYEATNVTYYNPSQKKDLTVDMAYIGFDNGRIISYGYFATSEKGNDQEIRLSVTNYGGVVLMPPIA